MLVTAVALTLLKLSFTDATTAKQCDSSAHAERIIVEIERRSLDTKSE